MNKINEKLFKDKPMSTLIILNKYRNRGKTVSTISKEIHTIFAHTLGIINDFESEGIIMSERVGRSRFVKLTKKGEEFVDLIQQIITFRI